nr:LysE family transporter [Paenibacillus sp. J5C2022]
MKGIVIGLSIAAPVGPIGVLVIRRTLTQGKIYGILSGLGAASADAVYGLIAGFGLSIVTQFLIGHRLWLQLVGGLFLCYLGIRTWMSSASEQPAKAQSGHLFGAFLSVFFLTLTNPVTILAFAGIFAGLGFAQSNTDSALTLVFGVFLGSALWWLVLSLLVGSFNRALNQGRLLWINRISGIVILLFGVYALLVH